MKGPTVLRAGIAAAVTGALLLPAGGAPASTRQGTIYKLPCSGARLFDIHVQGVKRRGITSAKITVNGKAARVRRDAGGFVATINLRKLGKVTVTVKITARTRRGRTITGTRIYHPCRPKLPDGAPPTL